MKRSATDLDDLYDFLQEKKELNVEEISRKFNVSEELVMEWGKILESGDLAVISSPRIGKPIIRIKLGEKRKEKDEKKGRLKKPEPELKKQDKKTIQRDNKKIKNDNKKKIKSAKELIVRLRKIYYNNEAIKKLFIDKGWPNTLIEDLLK